MNRDWLIGFIEGEGSFLIGIQNKKSYKYGLCVTPRFVITLHQKELSVLKKIKAYFEFGSIYITSMHRQRIRGVKASDQVTFVCQNLCDCLKIKSYLMAEEWHTTKRKDFELWIKGLEIIKTKLHLEPKGIIELCKIRDQMNTAGKKPRNYRDSKSILAYLKINYNIKSLPTNPIISPGT